MKNSKRNIILVAAFLVGVLFVAGLTLSFSRNIDDSEDANINSVSLEKNGGKLVVSGDGSVVFTNEEGVFFDQWSSDKTDAFFGYYDQNYQGDSQIVSGAQNSVSINKNGQTYTYILDEDDELADPAAEDAQNSDDETESQTPTPTSTTSSGGGGGSGGGSSGGGSGGGGDSECLYWTLSYCVIKRTPTPAPTGTPGPDANVIDAADCADYLENNTAPTIINNTVCIPD